MSVATRAPSTTPRSSSPSVFGHPKLPASHPGRELFLWHGEHDQRAHLEHGPLKFPAVFRPVFRGYLTRDLRVRKLASHTFQDHGLRRVIVAHHTGPVLREVARLAAFVACTAVPRAVQPHAPYRHDVRSAAGPRGRQPIIVGPSEAFARPFP